MASDMEEEKGVDLRDLREALINHVCTDKKTFFKHQQIDEKEMEPDEKKHIVTSVLNTSHSKFLSRFGMVLKKEHLMYFESQNYDEKHDELIREQIKQLRFNLDHERVLVKNRRYAAMMKLIEDKEYFSDYEMERRNPLLYNELVGRFVSPAERAKRLRPSNQSNSTLVDILLNQIDRDETNEFIKKQQEIDSEDSKESFRDVEQSDTETSQRLWGNFDDETTKESKGKSRKRHADMFITAGERDILREEFLGIMYNDFLMGKDAEFFDYSQVDANDSYDESNEKDQDCLDKYFEDDSQDGSQEKQAQNDIENVSEDELDIYMRHIEEHIKRQKEDTFHEEFDEDY